MSGFGELWDYHGFEVQWRQKLAARSARRIGEATYSDVRAWKPALVDNLCQYRVRTERMVAQQASECFFDAQNAGFRVYQVTVCHPDWYVPAGQLSVDDINQVREWMTRRARALSVYGQQRMLGFVDVAWDDRTAIGGVAQWCVHAHCLTTVEKRGVGKRRIRPVFRTPPPPNALGNQPLKIQRLRTDLDILRVREYGSRCLLLHHQQHRIRYHREGKSPGARDRNLSAARDKELTSVVNQLGPRPFWILSGLRRRADGVRLHDGAGSARR